MTTVSIHIDDTAPRAGEKLTGKVLLNISQEYHLEYSYGNLTLSLFGEEISRMKKFPTFALDKRTSRFFQTNDLELKRYPEGEKIPAGCYVFPFAIDLPESLPSSASFYREGDETGEGFDIRYTMVSSFHSSRYSDQKKIPIRSMRIPDERVFSMVPGLVNLRRSVLSPKVGLLAFGASVIDTQIGRGESLQVRFGLGNYSTAKVQQVKLQFIEKICWKSGQGKSREQEHVLASHTIAKRNVIILEEIGDAEPNSRRELRELEKFWSAGSLEKTLNEGVLMQLKHRININGQVNTFPLHVPEDTRGTFAGQLVQISHMVKVQFKTSTGAENPRVIIPIHVGDPPVRRAPLMANNVASTLSEVVPVPIPEDAVVADTTANVTVDLMLVDTSEYKKPALSSLVPLAPPSVDNDNAQIPVATPVVTPIAKGVSMSTLIEELTYAASGEHFDIIQNHVEEPEWVSFFHLITPEEYGQIISLTSQHAADKQAQVANLLSQHVNFGDGYFTCEYAAEAIRQAHDKSRVAELLIPQCKDISVNADMIRAAVVSSNSSTRSSEQKKADQDTVAQVEVMVSKEIQECNARTNAFVKEAMARTMKQCFAEGPENVNEEEIVADLMQAAMDLHSK